MSAAERKITQDLQDVTDEILLNREKPSDHFEVAAILESNGWSDKRAFETFGFENVFEMSKKVWKMIQHSVVFAPFTPMRKIVYREYPIAFLKSFFKGAVFALPMAISVISMLVIRFSLWSYVNFSAEIATAIAIGTILSFLTIGGFTQAIARQGYGYIKQGYYGMAKLSTFFFVRLGYYLSISIVVLLILMNFFLGIFSIRMLTLIVLYYFILNAIWLSVTIMYILDKELIFSGLMVLSIGLIVLLFLVFKIDIIVSQVISLAVVALLGALIALALFLAQARKNKKDGNEPTLPRKTIILNSVSQYFLYGFSYFAFLFSDRVIAWSTSDVYMPYIIWFRGEYELGLDFALLTLIIPMGFVEYIIRAMMESISGAQKDYYMYEVDKMYRRYRKMYLVRLGIMAVISIISGILIYLLLMLFRNGYFPFIDITITPITFFVFIIALIGYSFVAMGLMNTEILFCVSQVKMANRCIMPALLTTILVGFVLSRWIHYSYAVVGMAVAALLFFILGTIRVLHVLKKLDYYLYKAT